MILTIVGDYDMDTLKRTEGLRGEKGFNKNPTKQGRAGCGETRTSGTEGDRRLPATEKRSLWSRWVAVHPTKATAGDSSTASAGALATLLKIRNI